MGLNECFGRALGKGGVFLYKAEDQALAGGSNEGQRGESIS